MRIWIWFVLILLLVAGAGGWYWHTLAKPSVSYRMVNVRRGDLVTTISATGTLEPDEQVDVGAQVAGLIESFGKDSNGASIDYCSPVESGMVLAHIDDAVYKAEVDIAQAQLAQAKTAIVKGQADLAQANSKLLQAQHNWDRAQTVGPSDALSQNDYDMYQADYESAKAAVALANAEIQQAKDGVPLAEATLSKAQRDVDFCTIKSPVKGVIIDRRVNIGQTVVSSLNAPSLFLLARDLTKMQIWVAVNEADVGRLSIGTPVTFSCDAFPDRKFEGKVGKIRWNASMTQNVVMYTVVIEFDNSDKVLLPYLTARVNFETARQSNALIVPNQALRWTPSDPMQVTPAARASWKSTEEEAAPAPLPSHDHKHDAGAPKEKERHGTVWVKDGDFVRPVVVKLGTTDRVDTAVTSDELNESTEVVLSDMVEGGASDAKNPFLPPMQPRGR